MNPLLNARSGTLYDTECNFLLPVQYSRESLESATFIFSENPASTLPKQIFLLPDDDVYNYRAFLYTLSDKVLPYYTEEADNKVYYIVNGTTKDYPELRKNFRVYVSFRMSVQFEGQAYETPVTVKDIGTGGFLFVSEKKYKPGTTLSAIFTNNMKNSAFITAKVLKLRPVHEKGLYGHGCQFVNLTPDAEAQIHNFVYRTEIIQAKTKRDFY